MRIAVPPFVMLVCRPRLRVGVLLAAATSLAGCANLGDSMASSAFVNPAQYDLYDCKQLAATRTALTAQSAEQQRLIDKANTGVGGAVIGEVVYRSDYTATRAQLKLVNENWERSRCADAAPEPAAATPPAITPPPKPPPKPRG